MPLPSRSWRTARLLLTLATVIAVFIALGWPFIRRGFSGALPPEVMGSTISRADPQMPVQQAMQRSSEALLDATRVSTTAADGTKTFKMKWDAARGWQPAWNFPIDLAPCSEAAALPAWEWHHDWIEAPQQFRAQTPKTYDLMQTSQHPGVLLMDREPLLAVREARALTGQREHIAGALGPPFLVYINDTKQGDDGTFVAPLHVPYNAVLEFDRVAWTLTSVLERDAYPFILHLCADYLESEGLRWESRVPAPFSERFAGDQSAFEHWSPEVLSGVGRAFYEAVRTSSDMPGEFLGQRHDIFQHGAKGSPFHGGGLGPNLGALFWGEHFESYFHRDAVLAVKTAAFLAANTRARIEYLPDQTTTEPTNSQREANGAYVTQVANSWFTLGVASHPTMYVPLELPLGYGEKDLSYEWIRFMQEYVPRVLPYNGRFRVYDLNELQELLRTRTLLPPAFIDQSLPRLPH